MSFVRFATPADAAGIGRTQSRAWRQDYAEQLPPDALAALEPEAVAAEWTPVLHGASGGVVLVAVDADHICGFLAYEKRHECAEIHALVVDPDFRNNGHASRLMSAFADQIRDSSTRDALMWCPAADDALQTFLTSCGWAADGASRTLADGTFQSDELRFTTTFIGESPAPAAR